MKVCILASGLGSRIRQFGGRVHKALLPLGNQAVITRIIAQFPADAEFVVALGHLGDQVRDYLTVAHPELNVRFVTVDNYSGPGSGPGYSLLCCREHLDAPFYLTACDTLLTTPLPPLDGNVMATCRVEDPALWCTLACDEAGWVRSIHYKTAAGTHDAFVGLAAVHDHEAFWTALSAGIGQGTKEVQVDQGFSGLIPHGLRCAPSGWIDTGTDTTYEQAMAMFGKNYSFEGKLTDVTYRLDDRVLKLFPEADVARRRFERSRSNAAFAESVALQGQVFSYRFAEGAMLSAVQDGPACRRALDWLQGHFWRERPVDAGVFEDACRRFYRDKTLARLESYLSRCQPAGEVAGLKINGVPCRTVARAVDDLPDGFWGQGLASTFHGDLHDDNIVVQDDGLVLIDWREDFAGLPDVGDRYYDLAKFLHTLDLSVPVMDAGLYELPAVPGGVSVRHDVSAELVEAQQAFWEFAAAHGYDRRRIELLNGLIFISMAPFYVQPMAGYLYHLGRLRLENALGARA